MDEIISTTTTVNTNSYESFMPFNYTNYTNCTETLKNMMNMSSWSNNFNFNNDNMNATCYNNTMGYYEVITTSTTSINEASSAAVDLGNALAQVNSFQASARLTSSQCIPYLPLLFYYVLIYFFTVLFSLFPDLKNRAEKLQKEQMAQLQDALDAANAMIDSLDDGTIKDGDNGDDGDEDNEDGTKSTVARRRTSHSSLEDSEKRRKTEGIEETNKLHDAVGRHRALTQAITQAQSGGLMDVKYFSVYRLLFYYSCFFFDFIHHPPCSLKLLYRMYLFLFCCPLFL